MAKAARNILTVKALIAVIFFLIGLQYLSLLQVNDRAPVRGSGSLFLIHRDEAVVVNSRGSGVGGGSANGLAIPPTLFDTISLFPDVTSTSSTAAAATSSSPFPSSSSRTPTNASGLLPDPIKMSTTFNTPSVMASSNASEAVSTLSDCPLIPPGLHGPIKVVTDMAEVPSLDSMSFPAVTSGGRSQPLTCTARHRVAVIIPFRDREDHLRIFLNHMHTLLPRQQLDYGIFVVEQHGEDPFNRAMLLNVGVAEALKQYPFQCFVFHDVDLLPEDDRNIYSCPVQPRHMSVAIDSFLYKLPYLAIFGGVSAMTLEHFRLVNGFSNKFWGWGGEDDDMSNRIQTKKLFISRYPANIGRYKMLRHAKDKANPDRFKFLYSGTKRMGSDGYNSLKYKRVNLTMHRLYTWVNVELPHI